MLLKIVAGMTGQGLIGIFDSMPDRFCGRQEGRLRLARNLQ